MIGIIKKKYSIFFMTICFRKTNENLFSNGYRNNIASPLGFKQFREILEEKGRIFSDEEFIRYAPKEIIEELIQ